MKNKKITLDISNYNLYEIEILNSFERGSSPKPTNFLQRLALKFKENP